MISSRIFTSCTLPSVTRINTGILPCRSNSVCIFTPALCWRNFAHGKTAGRATGPDCDRAHLRPESENRPAKCPPGPSNESNSAWPTRWLDESGGSASWRRLTDVRARRGRLEREYRRYPDAAKTGGRHERGQPRAIHTQYGPDRHARPADRKGPEEVERRTAPWQRSVGTRVRGLAGEPLGLADKAEVSL